MSMHAAMGPVWRHMRTDRSAVESKVRRGTVRRVLQFAVPHRRLISVFLVLTVIDVALVGWLAAAMAGVAVLDSLLALVTGWFSSRIGEGLILDLRTAVFAHVQ